MIVREERTGEEGVVGEVVEAAFGSPSGVHLLLQDLRRSVAWLDLSFVAEEDDEVVAHVAYSRAWLDDPTRLIEVLVLSPMSVRPDRQRQGIGLQLIRDSLATLGDRREPVVFLEGDPSYYSRAGFRAGASFGFTPPSRRIPPPAFQALPLASYDPEMAGRLVYPDVWWRHDAVGLRP